MHRVGCRSAEIPPSSATLRSATPTSPRPVRTDRRKFRCGSLASAGRLCPRAFTWSEGSSMSTQNTLAEFRTAWLPHVTDAGLVRLIELLESGSPLLIHGAFSKACAMGCLATHIAWHHPHTRGLNDEAGVCWLTKVAKMNPATSQVILAWDRGG